MWRNSLEGACILGDWSGEQLPRRQNCDYSTNIGVSSLVVTAPQIMSDGRDGHELADGPHMEVGWTEEAATSVQYDEVEDGRVAVITLSRPNARNAW